MVTNWKMSRALAGVSRHPYRGSERRQQIQGADPREVERRRRQPGAIILTRRPVRSLPSHSLIPSGWSPVDTAVASSARLMDFVRTEAESHGKQLLR